MAETKYLTPKEMKEVKEMFKEVGRLFAKVGGAVNKASLKRFVEKGEGVAGVQDKAGDLYNEIDRYEKICSKDPGLYKRWKMAKENLHFLATYRR